VEDLHVHVSNFTARGEEKSKRFDGHKPSALEITGLTKTHRINNPFHGWMRIDVERMAKQLAQWYGAPEDVFVRVGKTNTLRDNVKLTVYRLPSYSSNPCQNCGTTESYLDSRMMR
jgi:hypothetical protein